MTWIFIPDDHQHVVDLFLSHWFTGGRGMLEANLGDGAVKSLLLSGHGRMHRIGLFLGL